MSWQLALTWTLPLELDANEKSFLLHLLPGAVTPVVEDPCHPEHHHKHNAESGVDNLHDNDNDNE